VARIGIPSRSSELHVLGIAQCLHSGLLSPKAYDPAKLLYCCEGHTLVLGRCDELCHFLDAGSVDLIFTGGDYAREHLSLTVNCVPVNSFSIQFVLLIPRKMTNSNLETVFTKFPRSAERTLLDWGIRFDKVLSVSGGSEAFCLMTPRAAAFDIKCTARTIEANDLKVVRSSESIYPGWYSVDYRMPPEIQKVSCDEILLTRLQHYYSQRLSNRDVLIRDNVARVFRSV
jgi:ATP phosphoribosyltransferase